MKSEVDDVIVVAIQRVLAGGYYLSDRMNTRIIHQFQEHRSTGPIPDSPGLSQLTDREMEVFELIGRGLQAHEIGERLHVSSKTVDSHRSNIREKLGLSSTTELIQRAALWVANPTLS